MCLCMYSWFLLYFLQDPSSRIISVKTCLYSAPSLELLRVFFSPSDSPCFSARSLLCVSFCSCSSIKADSPLLVAPSNMIKCSDILLVVRHCMRWVLPETMLVLDHFCCASHPKLRLFARSGDGGVGVHSVAKTKGNGLVKSSLF